MLESHVAAPGDGRTPLNAEQHPRKGFRASPWQPRTCGGDDALGPDCAKPLLGVHIRIPGSDRACSLWGMRVLWAVFKVLMHLSPIRPS